MKKATTPANPTAKEQIDRQIAELTDWRGRQMARLRKLIGSVDRDLAEGWKWGSAVWSLNGNVVALGVFKDHLKLNFFQGAALADSQRLFNAGLDAKATRAIDIHEGDRVDEAALKALLKEAVAHNRAGKKK
jgi:hypothetical protein